MERTLTIGQHLKVVDEHGVLHDGFITAHWGSGDVRTLKDSERPAINVAFVSADPAKTDNCGRQIERLTSTSYRTQVGNCPGRYWYFPDEQE